MAVSVTAISLALPTSAEATHRSEPCASHSLGFCESTVNRYAEKVRHLRRTLMHRSSVQEAITLASVVYRVPRSTLSRRAFCESKYNPRARNLASAASGLFQFLPSTFASTPFSSLSIFSPYANALAAGWMMSPEVGRGGEWVCR